MDARYQPSSHAIIESVSTLRVIGGLLGKRSPLLVVILFLALLQSQSYSHAADASPRVHLTSEERTWLEQNPHIKLVIPSDQPPFSTNGRDGKYAGILPEIFTHLSRSIGQEITFTSYKNSSKNIHSIAKQPGNYGVGAVFKVPQYKNDYLLTDAYLSTPIYIVTTRGKSALIKTPGNLQGKKIAILKGHRILDEYLNRLGDTQKIMTNSPLEQMQKVISNQADALLGYVTYPYLIDKYLMSDLVVSGVIEADLGIHVGINPAYPVLRNILNKAIAALDERQKADIMEKWTHAAQESLTQNKTVPPASGLENIGILSAIILAASIGILALMLRAIRNENLSRLFGSKSFRIWMATTQAFFFIAVAILAWWFLEHNRQQLSEHQKEEMRITLINTHENLHQWINLQKEILLDHGEHPKLVAATEQLMAAKPDAASLEKTPALNRVRQFDHAHLQIMGDGEFFIINPRHRNIASRHSNHLGTINPIIQQQPDLLDRVLQGEAVFIPPINLKPPLSNESQPATDSEPRMFIVAPIINQRGQVIAAFAKGLEPGGAFSRILAFGQIGTTGESYAFNKNGWLVSESRFNNQLAQAGLLKPGQSSSLNIRLGDPGGDLLSGHQPALPRQQQPLTRMAASALRGESAVDMTGYRDYRGVPVVGAWLWDNELGLGMATEVDRSEVYGNYYLIRWAVFAILGLVLIIAISGTTFALLLGEKAGQLLRRSRDDLEAQVRERTAELRRSDRQLRQQMNLLDAIINNVKNILIYAKDRTGAYLVINNYYVNAMGVTRQQVIGKTDRAFMPDKVADTIMKTDQEVITSSSPLIFRESIPFPDGTMHHYQTTKSPLRDQEKNIVGIVGIATDITEQIQVEDKLRSSEIEHRRILESLQDVYFRTDTKGRIVRASPSARQVTGYSSEELLGKPAEFYWRFPERSHEMTKAMKAGGGTVQNYEVEGRHKDGHTVWGSINAHFYFDDNKNPLGMEGTIRDITEHKHAEAELHKAKNAAEQANQAKSQFLSSMSHELRTPLNAILGFAQLYKYDKDLSDEKKANARDIYKAGAHLLTLVNEVLDLSKIESGHLELSMGSINLPNAIQECKELIAPLAESHGISIDVEATQHTSLFVKADYTRLKQVLLNLLSNAVKYNRRNGHIRIHCTSNDENAVRINVHDTGQGIAQNKLGKLFQPFNRLGKEFSNTEGTGIGLVITKQLVELMGGRIGVESVAGKGSTFWLELCLTKPEQLARQHKPAPAVIASANEPATSANELETISSSGKILIAEDNPANQAVLQQQLELLGLNAEVTSNGLQAWECWQREEYSLLLMDIHMPIMDGYELADKIRQAEKQRGGHLPIIAITANTMAEDTRQHREQGIDAYLMKPIDFMDLKTTLERWLSAKSVTPLEPELPESRTDQRDTPKKTENPGTGQPIDISQLARLVGNDKDRHRRLLQSFTDATPAIIQATQTAHKAHAADIIRQQAHKLKSSARSVGANPLADACQALETAAREDQWALIDDLVPRLGELYSRVDACIHHYTDPKRDTGSANRLSIAEYNVLLVDDDHFILDMGTVILNEIGVQTVLTAATGEKALAVLDDGNLSIDVIFCDLNMPGMDGLEFLRHLASKNYTGGVVLVSGEDARILKTAARLAAEHRLNVLGALNKPMEPAKIECLLNKLEETLQKRPPEAIHYHSPGITIKELGHAIENNELVAFYQPKVDVLTRQVIGVETLVRWPHPDKGMVPPFLIIQIAEEHGLIDALTQSIFKQAMQHTARLQAQGFNIKVAVNISVDTLNDLAWPDYAMVQANNAGVDPSQIILEITESRLMDNIASALEILTRLSLRKFRLSVDDFGTGYSSLEQLQRVPFSEMKIDRAFVHGATNDKAARAILESSVGLARKLDLSIVAEGVENQEDWDLVAELGCDQVQGYFIAKPMPIDALVKWLQAEKINAVTT